MRKNDSMEISHYINSTEAQHKLYKRSLFVVIMSQIFGGAGLAAGIIYKGYEVPYLVIKSIEGKSR